MHRINPVILSIVILLALTQTLYAETESWVLLKKINDNSALFYDSQSLRVIRNPHQISVSIVLKNQQDEAQSKALILFDCALESATMMNEFEYNKQGEVIYSWTEAVNLDLVDGNIPKFFCSRSP